MSEEAVGEEADEVGEGDLAFDGFPAVLGEDIGQGGGFEEVVPHAEGGVGEGGASVAFPGERIPSREPPREGHERKRPPRSESRKHDTFNSLGRRPGLWETALLRENQDTHRPR